MSTRLFTLGVLSLFLAGIFPVSITHAAGRYQDAYTFLASNGAISQADDGNANELLSRAEVLKVLLDSKAETRAKVEKTRAKLSKLPLFVDVSNDEWFAPYAETAYMSLVTTGFPDRTLRAYDPVPAEEAITLVMRAYKVKDQPKDNDEWFVPYVRAALSRNIIADPHSIAVGEAVTRGQFYDMAYRMAVVAQDNLAAFVDTSTGGGIAAGATQGSNAAQASGDPQDIRDYASAHNFAMTIPSLGIKDLIVTHSQDSLSSEGLLSVLQDGVGHLFQYPGNGGKIMIYGHSSGYSWEVSKYTKIFRTVNKLKKDDKVYVTYNGKLYVYSVTGQQTISPKDSSPFSGAGEELILYTCWPPNSIKQRLIVRAVPVDTVAVR